MDHFPTDRKPSVSTERGKEIKENGINMLFSSLFDFLLNTMRNNGLTS